MNSIRGTGLVDIPDLKSLVNGPGHPNWNSVIPPPAPDPITAPPDPTDILTAPVRQPKVRPPAVSNDQRVVITWGKKQGSLVVSVEQGRDCEVVTSVSVLEKSVRDLWPILESLGPIRNLTGEDFGPKTTGEGAA